MLVSVIIPTYYRNDTLPRAIESALAQTHEPIEIIIVDDSGEGNAASVVEDNEKSCIQYIELSENRGSQCAREYGVNEASGDYIQFLDDDDKIHPEKIERQLSLINASDSVGVAYSGLQDQDGQCVLPDPEVSGDILPHALSFFTWPCCIGTMLIDADIYAEVSPIPNKAEDERMKIELARRTQFDYISEPLLQISTGEDRSLGDSWWQIDGRRQIISDYSGLYEEYPNWVRTKAIRSTEFKASRLQAKEVFEEQLWSFSGTYHYLRAAFYAERNRAKLLALAGSSLLGRPGIRGAERVAEVLLD